MKRMSVIVLMTFFSFQVMAQTITVGVDIGFGYKVAEQSHYLLNRLTELTGISFTITDLPSRRLYNYLKEGKIDGSLPNAVAVYEDLNGNVLRVPEPIMQTTTFLYSYEKIAFNHLSELKGKKIIKVAGLKAINTILDANGIKAKEVNDVETALKMINAHHADAVVLPDIFAHLALLKLKDINIIENPTAIAHIDAFLWLLPKHKGLVDKLNSAILQLKKSGELDKIYSW